MSSITVKNLFSNDLSEIIIDKGGTIYTRLKHQYKKLNCSKKINFNYNFIKQHFISSYIYF